MLLDVTQSDGTWLTITFRHRGNKGILLALSYDMLDPADTVMLLIDHQSGLINTLREPGKSTLGTILRWWKRLKRLDEKR